MVPYQIASPILGPLIFSAYNIIILYFALNIFVSIIIASFDQVRMDAKKNPDKYGFLGHVIYRFKKLFQKKNNAPSHEDYKSHLDVFTNRVDKLIAYLIKVKHF